MIEWRPKTKTSRIVGSAAAVVLALAAAIGTAILTLGPPPLADAGHVSATVLDRRGQLLRAFTTVDGRWRLPVEPDQVDQRYLAMLLAFEDRRFRSHWGVDARAIGRAATQLARHGRIVSGVSTLTMQVARLLDGGHDRSVSAKSGMTKLRQMARALQLERTLSKDEILRLYLRLAPFGGNIEGVRAATLAYFGKEPRRLSIGEAALLVALPQSPEARRPDRFPAAAARARKRVLARAVEARVITAAEAARASTEPVPHARAEFPRLAPHLSEAEVARHPDIAVHRLTIDRDLQQSLETLARGHARSLGDRMSAAVLVVDHRSGEVLAHVGSSDYHDESRLGAIDMTAAVRSPGSTLKPVIYGLAFEGGIAHPETLIEDRPVRFGSYQPKNFDDGFHGTVSAREALANSLNIPAVKLLNAIGPGRLITRFRRIGLQPIVPGDGEPTLAIALGGLGLRLSELAELYAGLARGGESVSLRHTDRSSSPLAGEVPRRGGGGEAPGGDGNKNTHSSVPGVPPSGATRHLPRVEPEARLRRDGGGNGTPRLLSPVAAWYVTDILKDAPPPANAVGGRIAYKTGTSYGYRDAWAIGYDGHHTIAVWTGRADGASTPGLTGRGAAAPILFDAFQRLGPTRAALSAAPAGSLKASGATLPPPLKRFAEPHDEARHGAFLDPPVQIAFPPDRADVEVAGADVPLVLKAEGGALPLTWLADGAPLDLDGNSREVEWLPAGPGFVKLSVIDAKGRVDRVTVRLR